MLIETLIEGVAWFTSMLAVSGLSFALSRRLHSAQSERAAMPKINAQEGARLFFIFGLTYLLVAVASGVLVFSQGPELASQIHDTMRAWWLVEIFIFLNIITGYCLYTALKRLIVNI